jgi:outer membrane protein, multidrug efflux system
VGGALEGQLDLTTARKQELVASYRQTVLTSFKEVEDALSTVETSAARVRSLQTAADQAREAFRLAQLSYSAGASDFLTVLDAQRTLLDNEDSLVQAQRDRFTAAASLFKALGGGWAGSA